MTDKNSLDCPSLPQQIQQMSISRRIRLALIGNRGAREVLIRDPNQSIALAVMKNHNINEEEILHYAQRRDLAEEIIYAISKNPKWMKYYPLKLAIVSNPKSPLPLTIGLLPHLHNKDLRFLSRSKDISSVLVRAAHQTLLKRILNPFGPHHKKSEEE